MTTTLSPPPASAAEPSRPPLPAPPEPRRTSGRPAGPWVAEILLVAVTLVAVAGFARLFADRSTVVPLLVAAVGAHLVGAVARRRGWGALPTATVTLAAFVVQASVVLYPHTSVFGVPTPATLDAVAHDLGRAWELFGEVRAPAPRSRGFLLASTLTLWVAVALADWAAFRLRTTAEAVLPAAAVFVFTTLLGRGGGGVALTALLIAAVLAFAAAQRAGRAGRDDAWVGGRSRAGVVALGRAGAIVALAVAVLGGVIGPRLPTADDEALVDWRGEQGPDARTTVSPLVDIRSRLVEQSPDVLFTVVADRPAYWRVTSLPDFDGQSWGSSEKFSEADGSLPSEPPDAATEELRQEFTIGDLGSIWGPAALTPVELVDSTGELRWNGELATLIVPQEVPSIDGTTYTVVSQVPSFTPEDLDARQPDELPEEIQEATRLPELPPIVATEAAAAVAGAGSTPYGQALALQDWFRGTFQYDLDGVGAGHSGTAIEAFLEARRGYCEQFAGTYAAMARTLGIPARVAVGFTPGESTEDGFTVRGRNAHAWPEVWISGAGWVPFEPTPGRGQPGAEGYTGVTPEQAEAADEGPSTTEAAPTTAAGPGPGETTIPPTTLPRDPDLLDTADDPATTADDAGRPAWLVAVLLVLLVGVVLAALDVALIALVRRHRARGQRPDGSVPGRVRVAWGHALDALRLVGVAPAPAETAREFARRASGDLGDAGPALSRLAGLVTATTWSPAAVRADPALGQQADELAHTISHRIHADAGWRPRLRAAVDPRTLRTP